jgi:hypothetical protein
MSIWSVCDYENLEFAFLDCSANLDVCEELTYKRHVT